MIRKWSRIVNLNFSIFNIKKIRARYTYKSFRKGVLFKKGFIKKTRIKRNRYSMYKHIFNWAIYVQIWQNWVKDFKWHFYISKFQYYKNFNQFEIISYNSYFFNNKKLKLISNYEYFVNCFLSKKLIFYYLNKNFKNFYFNFLHFFSYPLLLLKDSEFPIFPNLEFSTFPIIFNIEKHFYNLSYLNSFPFFELTTIFEIIENLILIQIFELRKIFSLILYYQLNN